MAKNNKQKPPNTLLSSQTTDLHFPRSDRASNPRLSPRIRRADSWNTPFPETFREDVAALRGFPRRSDSTKLRQGKHRVKSPGRRADRPDSHCSETSALCDRHQRLSAFHPGDIPLAAPQHQPIPMEEVRRLRGPVLALDPPVVHRRTAFSDSAARGALTG